MTTSRRAHIAGPPALMPRHRSRQQRMPERTPRRPCSSTRTSGAWVGSRSSWQSPSREICWRRTDCLARRGLGDRSPSPRRCPRRFRSRHAPPACRCRQCRRRGRGDDRRGRRRSGDGRPEGRPDPGAAGDPVGRLPRPGPGIGGGVDASERPNPTFAGQVIPGFSGMVDNGDGTFWALPDNGFGTKAQLRPTSCCASTASHRCGRPPRRSGHDRSRRVHLAARSRRGHPVSDRE